MRFKILEQAELELDDAYDYYEYELEGLGRKFLFHVKKNSLNNTPKR